MGDFDRNIDRRSSSRGRFDKSSSRGRFDKSSSRGRFGGREGGRDRGSFGGRDRDGGRERRTERLEMHSAVCDKCGKDCEVPFRPTEGKPIYCDDCFKDKNMEAGSRSEMGKPKSNETFDQLHKKLDRILKILEEPILGKDTGKDTGKEQPEVKEPKKTEKSKNIEEEPELEYAKDIEKKKPKKKKAKKKK